MDVVVEISGFEEDSRRQQTSNVRRNGIVEAPLVSTPAEERLDEILDEERPSERRRRNGVAAPSFLQAFLPGPLDQTDDSRSR